MSIVLALISVLAIDSDLKSIISLILVIVISIIYIIIFIYKFKKIKKCNRITLNFDSSTINIYEGDIFDIQNNGFKIIAFNEYFDTITDDESHIIDPNSLHGKYLNKFYENNDSRDAFHKKVISQLRENKVYTNINRKKGYKEAYELGTLLVDGEYLLLSFTKFDDDNRAHIKYSEMVNAFIKMWFNIDKVKGNKKVYLPLIGSGITRFDDGYVSNQEILIALIETFRISRVRFRHPANVNILLHNSNSEIDLASIKEIYK